MYAKYFLSLAALFTLPSWAVVTPINSDSNTVLNRIKSFHAATYSSGTPRPNIASFTKERRLFVAKMDSFGLDRYFVFENDDDASQIITAVRNGGAMSVDWYYTDLALDESALFIGALGSSKPSLVISKSSESEDNN